MSARILDGKALAKVLKEELEVCYRTVMSHDVTPKLAIVFVGDDPASAVYAKSKINACKQMGADAELVALPATMPQNLVLAAIDRLNRDFSVHGIFVEMPLPRGYDEATVRAAVSPAKDVDCIHPDNVGLLAMGQTRFAPCTPLGVMILLQRLNIPIKGRHVCVLGRSNVIGRPLAMLMLEKKANADATVTICHTGTPDPKVHSRQADIVVAAMGQRETVKVDWIRPGSVVIDVGIHDKDGKLVGDVDFANVSEVASAITPVPGGVGAVTVTMLLNNLLKASCLARGIDMRNLNLF